ncbi:MAG: hypothetical protein GY847_00945 [Proteobacteria bacterium]|nr:hypothetical protein [Pseudomonadota bacterium]
MTIDAVSSIGFNYAAQTSGVANKTPVSSSFEVVDGQKTADGSETGGIKKESTNTDGIQQTEKTGPVELTEEEQREVEELRERDREVRQHEQAHIAAGGPYVRGGAKYAYEQGPDNMRYAVGGEVGIDTSQGTTPQETIQKAQVVRRAALAPSNPSSQDRSVAAQATKMEAAARQELAAEHQEAVEKVGGNSTEEQPDKNQENTVSIGRSVSHETGMQTFADRVRASSAERVYGKTSRNESSIVSRSSKNNPGQSISSGGSYSGQIATLRAVI